MTIFFQYMIRFFQNEKYLSNKVLNITQSSFLNISWNHFHYQIIKAMFTTQCVSHATCQVSDVRFLSGVMCHFIVFFFFSFFLLLSFYNKKIRYKKVVDLVCGGSVINGTTPSSLSVFSRPGQSQGLLYKHLCHWLSD